MHAVLDRHGLVHRRRRRRGGAKRAPRCRSRSSPTFVAFVFFAFFVVPVAGVDVEEVDVVPVDVASRFRIALA
jgi:hypothetical protein